MKQQIHKCPSCSQYTLNQACSCGTKTELPCPPKFSLQDKYASYRREAKKESLKEKGLY